MKKMSRKEMWDYAYGGICILNIVGMLWSL